MGRGCEKFGQTVEALFSAAVAATEVSLGRQPEGRVHLGSVAAEQRQRHNYSVEFSVFASASVAALRLGIYSARIPRAAARG